MKPIIGDRYFEHFIPDPYVNVSSDLPQNIQAQLKSQYPEILSVAEHNPQITFSTSKRHTVS